jgi:hypothetical protein
MIKNENKTIILEGKQKDKGSFHKSENNGRKWA